MLDFACIKSISEKKMLRINNLKNFSFLTLCQIFTLKENLDKKMNQLNTHHKLHAEYFHLSLATDLLRKTEQKHNFLSEHGGTLYGASQACLRSGSSGFS